MSWMFLSVLSYGLTWSKIDIFNMLKYKEKKQKLSYGQTSHLKIAYNLLKFNELNLTTNL